MNYFVILIASFLAVIFQNSFLVQFPIFGWVINLSLILAVWILIYRNFKEAIFFAFFSGLFSDFFSAKPFGLSLISFILCIVLLGFFQKFIKINNLARFLISLPIALIIYEVLIRFLPWLILAITK